VAALATGPRLAALLDAERALDAALAELRRRRLAYGDDPADWPAVHAAATAAHHAAHAAIRDLLPAGHADVDELELRAGVAGALDRLEAAAGDAYLRLADAADAATREALRLRALPPRPDDHAGHRPSLRAMFNRPRGRARERAILELAGHLLARRVAPGATLGLLESWDRDRCRPPLGAGRVEELLRWVADRQQGGKGR
jgi:hypothetical protein